jgi:type I restriction enzyme S subunit
MQKQIAEQIELLDRNINDVEIMIKNNNLTMKYYINCCVSQCKNVMKIGDICEIKYGTRIRKNNVEVKDINVERYPCYGGGDISFYMGEFNRTGENLVISRFGLSKNCVRLVNNKFWLNDSGFTLHSICDTLLQKYLNYHVSVNLQNVIFDIAVGACQKNLQMNDFKKIEIPIPSLKVQQDIIGYCDNIQTTNETLEQQCVDNKKLIKKIFKTYLQKTD